MNGLIIITWKLYQRLAAYTWFAQTPKTHTNTHTRLTSGHTTTYGRNGVEVMFVVRSRLASWWLGFWERIFRESVVRFARQGKTSSQFVRRGKSNIFSSTSQQSHVVRYILHGNVCVQCSWFGVYFRQCRTRYAPKVILLLFENVLLTRDVCKLCVFCKCVVLLLWCVFYLFSGTVTSIYSTTNWTYTFQALRSQQARRGQCAKAGLLFDLIFNWPLTCNLPTTRSSDCSTRFNAMGFLEVCAFSDTSPSNHHTTTSNSDHAIVTYTIAVIWCVNNMWLTHICVHDASDEYTHVHTCGMSLLFVVWFIVGISCALWSSKIQMWDIFRVRHLPQN